MQRELGIHCLCHKLWRCCCHPLTLHRSHYTEEPGKLKRNICVTEECKKKHSSPLMCCLYFHLVFWLSISGLYDYSHHFKICSNSQLVLAPLTHFLRWRCVCTVCVQGEWRRWTSVASLLSGLENAFSFPMCTWSSSLQRFPGQSGLKDSPVQLNVCSYNQSVEDEQLVCYAKDEHGI